MSSARGLLVAPPPMAPHGPSPAMPPTPPDSPPSSCDEGCSAPPKEEGSHNSRVLIGCVVGAPPTRAGPPHAPPSSGPPPLQRRELESGGGSSSSRLAGGWRQDGHHASTSHNDHLPHQAPRCCGPARVMQQKAASSGGHHPSSAALPSSKLGVLHPPLRSALKRTGQRGRGLRVTIDEAQNQVVEADYVILVRAEEEPRLVSIRTFDLGLDAAAATDQVTLSPPDGYKDVFRHAVRENIEDSDTESGGVDPSSGWGLEVHDPDCPRANLPDVVSSQRCSQTNLTVENVRHHDQLMEDDLPEGGEEGKVAKTGILKGGKLWKNGADNRKPAKVEVESIEKSDEPRRSVRFSGRDEYTTLEAAAFDNIPFDMSNEAALACFLSPKFRELSALLGDAQSDWHVELIPIAGENGMSDLETGGHCGDIQHHHPTCAKHSHKMNDHQLDDEHISESVQRYDEMRRRIAVAEGRDNNSVCSDESKSSSDSQSSDSTATETRIRRLENTDVAQVAGGIMRSNSEVRRAIERNALRRSLIRFAEARKKDTNKNEKNEKQESSLIEKLKWLTASEDATNGNADEKTSQNEEDVPRPSSPEIVVTEVKSKCEERKISYCTIEQYRKLAEMFNQTTSIRSGDVNVPGDVRDWKLESELFQGDSFISELEIDDLPPGTLTFTAVPAVSVCEQISDEEADKLIYSGGIRYTKEGTLAPGEQKLRQNGLTVPRERQPHLPHSESYSMDDIDEVLHDDRSSSVPSSSQSSPRLSGRSDVDGTSTAESGYSSNETNSELGQMLPPHDELAEFVKQDAGRMDRLRKRYIESEDHGFCRRPSVRGIKPRFGSTTDLLKQMANQMVPPNMVQPSMTGSHMTWPYRDAGEEESGRAHPQRRRVGSSSRNTPLPALQEDIPYAPPSEAMYSQVPTNSVASSSSGDNKSQRVVHTYSSSSGDLRVPAPPRLALDPSDVNVRPMGQLPPQRAQSYSTLPQVSQFASNQIEGQNQGMIVSSDHHHPSCGSRRPASVHGHAPTDMLISGPQHPTPPNPRPYNTLPHQSYPRSQCQSHEDPIMHENSHMSLGPRGSYPSSGMGGQYAPDPIHDHHNNVPISYQHSSQSQASPIESQPPIGHQTQSNYTSQRLQSGHVHDRSYCPGWHSSNSNPNFVHSPHSIPPPIISSQMSYTTPIVPESTNPRPPGANIVNGMLIKMEMERGVPEGASSSPRVVMDSQYSSAHHPPPRDSGLIHHHPQTMNVST